MQCMRNVDSDKITHINCGKTRRRMCEDCKAIKLDNLKLEKERMKVQPSLVRQP